MRADETQTMILRTAESLGHAQEAGEAGPESQGEEGGPTALARLHLWELSSSPLLDADARLNLLHRLLDLAANHPQDERLQNLVVRGILEAMENPPSGSFIPPQYPTVILALTALGEQIQHESVKEVLIRGFLGEPFARLFPESYDDLLAGAGRIAVSSRSRQVKGLAVAFLMKELRRMSTREGRATSQYRKQVLETMDRIAESGGGISRIMIPPPAAQAPSQAPESDSAGPGNPAVSVGFFVGGLAGALLALYLSLLTKHWAFAALELLFLAAATFGAWSLWRLHSTTRRPRG